MKEILIPLNFTTTPTVYDTKQSFSTSDEASGVLTFTTTADVAGTVASLTIRNASENANRQTVLIERLDVNSSPFSYALKNPLPFGQYEGTVLLKKNLTVIASATFLFGVNSSLSAEVLPDLVKAYSLDELVENVETEVSNLKDAFNLTVSETVKGVNKTESTLQAQENVRYLNEHTRKANEVIRIANEQARVAAELDRKDTFDTLVDSAVIEETVAQEVAEKYQELEQIYAEDIVSVKQQLEQAASYIISKNFTGISGGEKIQKALDASAVKPNVHNVVVVDAEGPDADGIWLIKSQLKIPSNTTLLLNGAYLKLDNQVNYAIMTNSDYVNGNSNIHIEGHGATLDCNRANQDLLLNNYRNNGLHLYNVDKFSVKGINLKDSPRWSLVPEKCTNGVIDDIYFDNEGYVNQDGVHIIGPSSNIIATKIRGVVGDDACVVNARIKSGTFQGFGNGGDVTDVVFDDIIITGGIDAHTGLLRTSGSASTVISNIKISNAIGYNLMEGLLRLGGNDAILQENHRNITANNITGYGTINAVSLFHLLRPVTNLQINNARVISKKRGLFSFNSKDVDGLQLSNIYREITGDESETGSTALLYFDNATFKNIQIINLQIKHTNPAIKDSVLANFNNSTVSNLQISNVQALCAANYFNIITGSIVEKTRMNNINIDTTNLDNMNMQVAADLIVNGFAVESGTSGTPTKANYQVGDMVKYVNTSDGTTKLKVRDNRGIWYTLTTT